jgi:hypothetical protein
LYHGRSVLDHLIWALVKANRETPGKHNEFPILPGPPTPRRGESKRDAFLRVLPGEGQKLAGVHPDAVALIESLQPYNGRNPKTNYLAVLNKMARDDRHHALHPSLVALGDPSEFAARLVVPIGVTIKEWEPLFKARSRVKPGTKLARFRLTRYRRYPQVGVETNLPAYVAFGKPPVSLAGLHDINRRLADLLGVFAEFL